MNRHSIQFLLRDSGGDDFSEHFPKYDTVDNGASQAKNTRDESQGDAFHFEETFGGSPLLRADLDFELLFQSFETRSDADTSFQWPWVEFPVNSDQESYGYSPPSLSPECPVEALRPRAADIKARVYHAIDMLKVSDSTANFQLASEAIELVTPEKIHSFVKLYFHHWHRHGPIIHEPSFDSTIVALPLLLSVFAIGGMYSKIALEVSMIKSLLDILEIVFYGTPGIEDQYEFRQAVPIAENDFDEQRQLEEFQGAYLMIVAQYWAGNAVAKQRVRQQRFMRLISVRIKGCYSFVLVALTYLLPLDCTLEALIDSTT